MALISNVFWWLGCFILKTIVLALVSTKFWLTSLETNAVGAVAAWNPILALLKSSTLPIKLQLSSYNIFADRSLSDTSLLVPSEDLITAVFIIVPE